ncbi:choice-of-anchor L domain-containing protein [Naasia lichenicola]|uniref:Fibronectin type-III domain-containing protein n=1 Tax=Naasia lichenicola TaxID=2565933 RepID=A0A4S4FRE1_9MICO|nr:choice-of-anchor L domain-containing protein [Naasia lichenicola]THG30779.1 hypothetical protein E6C64_09070 [Naasia lichenicola]THG32016.1 hypothetical protein E6C64_08215 [Naasia lichenicola]
MRARIGIAIFSALLMVVGVSSPASAHPWVIQPGTVQVTITAPDGVAANVAIRRVDKKVNLAVAAKPAAGKTQTVKVAAAVGAYAVSAPAMIVAGVLYEVKNPQQKVVVLPNRTTKLTVSYVASGGASDLHTTGLTTTSVTLAWTTSKESTYLLRRAIGDVPPSSPTQGVAVPIKGSTAIDAGLTAGKHYSYALFTKSEKKWSSSEWHGNSWSGGHWSGGYGSGSQWSSNRWSTPLTLTAGTAPPAGSTDASYVAEPTTLIATAKQINSATPTDSGVTVVLADGVPTPVLGAAVILPISTILAGGYLGVVASISTDGRTLQLTTGGLADAFNFYQLASGPFSTDPSILTPQEADAIAAATPTPTVGSPAAPNTLLAPTPTDKVAAARQQDTDEATAAPAPHSLAAAAPATVKCNDGGVDPTADFKVAAGGHFNTTVDKHSFLGVEVNVGATVDTGLALKSTGALDIKLEGKCGLEIAPLYKQISVYPVPIGVLVSPYAEISVTGTVEIKNVGMTATAGISMKGTLSLSNGPKFSTSKSFSATPTQPGGVGFAFPEIGMKLGSSVVLGPGIGSKVAGIIAGIKGTLDPFSASFKLSESPSNPGQLCGVVNANFALALGLTATAWFPKWPTASIDISSEDLNGEFPYPGFPITFPNGCDKPVTPPPAPTPPNSLFGDGVTKVNDSTTGTSDQVGYVEGFVPGAKTWVLSTGSIARAVGSPGQLASTNLGLAGDAQLTALAGRPTFDAVAYQVTVVPKGTTLHVRYVFASEEYPEYVGSAYNDAMAVFVNGVNCAYVPGTTTPVAVNTVNAQTNSAYYIDNAAGVAGYSTSMDGLTKPLTCDVPVKAGVPVTVRIAVADASDSVLDSAVALVDGGIWSN